MKYCTKCGERLLDGATFCTACGQPVELTKDASTRSHQASPLVTQPRTNARRNPNSRRTKLIGIAAIVGVVAIGGVLFMKNQSARTGANVPVATAPSVSSAQPSVSVPPSTNPQVAPVGDARALACSSSPPGGAAVTEASSKNDILALQWGLATLGYETLNGSGVPLPQNGEYDSLTREAVKRFQADKKHNLPVTGVANATTWAEMSRSLHSFNGTNYC